MRAADHFTHRAACRTLDSADFFDDAGDLGTERARRACQTCPVAAECLADALDAGDSGFRAGTTTADRRTMRKRRTPASPFASREHGTEAGYLQHRRANDDACSRCKAAHAVAEQLRRHSA